MTPTTSSHVGAVVLLWYRTSDDVAAPPRFGDEAPFHVPAGARSRVQRAWTEAPPRGQPHAEQVEYRASTLPARTSALVRRRPPPGIPCARRQAAGPRSRDDTRLGGDRANSSVCIARALAARSATVRAAFALTSPSPSMTNLAPRTSCAANFGFWRTCSIRSVSQRSAGGRAMTAIATCATISEVHVRPVRIAPTPRRYRARSARRSRSAGRTRRSRLRTEAQERRAPSDRRPGWSRTARVPCREEGDEIECAAGRRDQPEAYHPRTASTNASAKRCVTTRPRSRQGRWHGDSPCEDGSSDTEDRHVQTAGREQGDHEGCHAPWIALPYLGDIRVGTRRAAVGMRAGGMAAGGGRNGQLRLACR